MDYKAAASLRVNTSAQQPIKEQFLHLKVEETDQDAEQQSRVGCDYRGLCECLGKAFPVSDGHWSDRLSGPSLIGKYIYFSSIQAFSTVSPKLFFLLCKISVYVKKTTQNIMKHCPEICAKSWKSISLFLTQLLNNYIELKSVNSCSFIHVSPTAAAESASAVTSRLWSRVNVTVCGLKQSESAEGKFGIWAGNEPQAASWFFFRRHWNIYFLI